MARKSGVIMISSGLPQFQRGTAGTRHVLASGPPAAPTCSAHLMSVTRALLGTAHGGVQGAGELCQAPVLCWQAYSGRASASMLQESFYSAV